MNGQKKRILKYIKEHGSITQKEAVYLGCWRLGARIYDLKAEPYNIPIITTLETVQSTDGSTARIARYMFQKGYKLPEKYYK